MKYIAYTRKSKAKKVRKNGEWVLEEDPLSHHFQVEEIRKHIGDSELVVFSESDHSRDSSFESRPILSEALNCIKKEDILIVWKSDRIVADQNELIQLLLILEKRKARAISVCEPNFFDDNPISEFMRTVMVGVNRLEVQTIRSRIKTALQAKKERGERVGHIPFGYKLSDGKYIVPDDDEQATIKHMSELYLDQGLTYRGVVEALNDKGILNRGERPWSHSAVHRILRAREGHAEVYLRQ